MLVQVSPVQVPSFWEALKFTAVKSANVKEEYLEAYCLELLQDLLAGQKVCYVAQEEDQILFVFVLSFKVDKLQGDRFMYINNLYAFTKQSDEAWAIVYNDLIKIAKHAECIYINWDTNNEQIMQMSNNAGAVCLGKLYQFIL